STRFVHLISFIHRVGTPFPRGLYTSYHSSIGLVHPFHEVCTPHIIHSQGWYTLSTRFVHLISFINRVSTPFPRGLYTSYHSFTGLVHPFHEVSTPHIIHSQG
ncbi:hypothetical protein V8G54_023306, partial [Vigna mungo]